jgi:hypothetical protein
MLNWVRSMAQGCRLDQYLAPNAFEYARRVALEVDFASACSRVRTVPKALMILPPCPGARRPQPPWRELGLLLRGVALYPAVV